MNPTHEQLTEFLTQSNAIEGEHSTQALGDAFKAWQYADSLTRLGMKELLKTHRILLRNIRPHVAGRIRNTVVSIAQRIVGYGHIREDLTHWLHDFNPLRHMSENDIKQAHVRFERIHPFADGNGRVGRIIYNLHRLRSDLPLHIIHAGKEQLDYYSWF